MFSHLQHNKLILNTNRGKFTPVERGCEFLFIFLNDFSTRHLQTFYHLFLKYYVVKNETLFGIKSKILNSTFTIIMCYTEWAKSHEISENKTNS